MWVFLNDAFLSIVAHRDQPGQLMVRARFPGDIERTFDAVDVAHTPTADYAYRAVLPKKVVAEAMARAVEDVDYPNFKDSVFENDRHLVYLGVWSRMKDAQEQADAALEAGAVLLPAKARAKPAPRRKRRAAG